MQPTHSNLAKLTLELEVYGQTLCLFVFFSFQAKENCWGDEGAKPCHCKCCSTGLDAVCDLSLQVCLTDVPAVLVLCWMELIFSTVAGMGVHFRFVLEKNVDNTGMFVLLLLSSTWSQDIFCSSTIPPVRRMGGAQGIGRGHSGTADRG